MEAIGLFFTKFSEELLSAQIALLSFSVALGIYWMLIRRKKKENAEWVPAALVKAYLDRMRADEHETRVRLFGESAAGPMPQASAPLTQQLSPGITTTVVSNDPALMKEIDALRSQLAMADQRAMEFDRNLNGIKAEKGSLETKLKDALAAGAAGAGSGAGAADPAAAKELEDLRAKLAEYEVIEDEIANAKKLLKENEQLRQRLSALEGGGANLTVVQGGAAATEAVTKVSGTAEKIEAPVTVIAATPAKAEPVAAAAPAPAPATPAAAPSGEANTNVLAPVTPVVDAGPAAVAPAATAAPAADKSSKQKEEELLSEFEKMLAS